MKLSGNFEDIRVSYLVKDFLEFLNNKKVDSFGNLVILIAAVMEAAQPRLD